MSAGAGGLLDALDDGDALHLRLGNGLASVAAGQQALARFGERHALTPRVVNRLEVVFEEIVSNIVRHGFTPGSRQSIAVAVIAGAEALRLVFEDDGAPFDPLLHGAPPPLRTLADAPLGGLGVALVRRLAADIRYTRPSAMSPGGSFTPVNRLEVTLSTA